MSLSSTNYATAFARPAACLPGLVLLAVLVIAPPAVAQQESGGVTVEWRDSGPSVKPQWPTRQSRHSSGAMHSNELRSAPQPVQPEHNQAAHTPRDYPVKQTSLVVVSPEQLTTEVAQGPTGYRRQQLPAYRTSQPSQPANVPNVISPVMGQRAPESTVPKVDASTQALLAEVLATTPVAPVDRYAEPGLKPTGVHKAANQIAQQAVKAQIAETRTEPIAQAAKPLAMPASLAGLEPASPSDNGRVSKQAGAVSPQTPGNGKVAASFPEFDIPAITTPQALPQSSNAVAKQSSGLAQPSKRSRINYDDRRLPKPSKPTGDEATAAFPQKKQDSASIDLGFIEMPVDSVTMVVAALATVVGLFLLLAWVMRRSMPKSAQSLPSEVVEVIGRLNLANRQVVQMVRFGNKLVLLNVSGESIDPIAEITDPEEVNRLLGLCEQNNPRSASAAFSEVFDRLSREPARPGFLGDEAEMIDREQLAAAYANTPGGRAYG